MSTSFVLASRLYPSSAERVGAISAVSARTANAVSRQQPDLAACVLYAGRAPGQQF